MLGSAAVAGRRLLVADLDANRAANRLGAGVGQLARARASVEGGELGEHREVEPGDDREAFEEAYQSLKKRIEAFLALPLETMTPQEAAVAARRTHTGE